MNVLMHYKDIQLVETQPDDLDRVIEIEWDKANNDFVYKWNHAQHMAVIESDNWHHLLIQDSESGRTVGYVMLDGIASPHNCIELTRITISDKGQGYGSKAVSAVKKLCFETLGCHRLWLDVYSTNKNAIALYEKKGFKYEGTFRECKKKGDSYHSMNIMSLLEWEYSE